MGWASALFQSINTRHAGMASFSMGGVDAATLLLYTLMMFLAPSPFVAVLQQSDEIKLATRKLRELLAASVRVEREWRDLGTYDGEDREARRAQFCSRMLSVLMVIGADGEADSPPDDDDAEPGPSQQQLYLQSHSSDVGGGGGGVADAAQGQGQGGGGVAASTFWEQEVDTRLLLLAKYPAGRVPRPVALRESYAAVKYSATKMATELAQASAVRDMFFLFTVWFIIIFGTCPRLRHPRPTRSLLDTARTSAHHLPTISIGSLCANHLRVDSEGVIDPDSGGVGSDNAIFPVLFELVSAFGNVGLTLGSMLHTDAGDPLTVCAFSVDLRYLSQFLIMLTMVVGRTRDFPSSVDSSLCNPYTTIDEVRSRTYLGTSVRACA